MRFFDKALDKLSELGPRRYHKTPCGVLTLQEIALAQHLRARISEGYEFDRKAQEICRKIIENIPSAFSQNAREAQSILARIKRTLQTHCGNGHLVRAALE